MTAAERKRVVEAFSQRIRAQGFLRLQQVPKVFEEEKLDKALYAGAGPKRWIAENFPEFHVDPAKTIVTLAGQSAPAPESGGVQLSASQRQALVEHFQDEIDRAGQCWCSNVAGFMRNNGLPEWRQLVRPGESLPAWLAREFPEFRHDTKNGASAIFPWNGGPASGPEDVQRPRLADAQLRSISFKFACFPMNGEALGQLQQLTGNPALRHENWHSICVQKATCYLMGMDVGLLDDSGSQPPRMALPLDLKTERGQSLYVVLVPNTDASASQRWMAGGFCYPGQRDPAGFGKWLCQTFGLPSEDQDLVRAAYEQIRQRAQELEQLRLSLLDGLKELSAALERGEAMPPSLARQIAGYQEGWQTLRDAMDSAVLPLPQEQANLTYISGLLDSRGAVSTQIGQADKSFQRLVQGSWSYLLDNWLCGEDRSEGDLEGWRQVREQSESDSAMISGCRRLLQPFQSLLELTRPRTMFDSTVSAAADTANSHFGMELTPPVVRSSFCKVMQDTPGVLSFLEEVSVIESLLNHAEALSTDRHETRSVSAQTAGGFQTSCPQLLRELGEGQDRTGAILAAFPRPDPLEQAVMLGQTEEARALLEDPAARKELELDEPEEILDRLERIVPLSGEFSLYGAGMRLALTLGSRRGQAERCFLVGLSMGDLRCVECLFNLYRPAGRNEELDALYTAFGSQISEELRGKFVSSLLLSGSIDPLQSLREDVLSFLAPELLERFTAPDSPLPDETVRLLREIGARLDVPFVRYVVFLSGELQSYILHPENIEALRAAGIGQTMEQLVSLTKSGHYAKGRSPLQTARRVYRFLGGWSGLADAFASLIPEDTAVRDFRIQAARDRQDEGEMLRLLREDPLLRDKYWREYSALLFSQGDYAAFLDLVSSQEEVTEELRLRTAIAAIRTGRWDGSLPPLPGDEGLAGCIQLMQELAQALLDTGHTEQLYTLQLGLFDQVLGLHSSVTLRRFLTVDGAMDQDALAGLQQRALEEGRMSLAVYCGSVLGVEPQRIAGQSEAYFASLMQEVLGQDAAEQLSAIRRIRIIFGEQYAAHQVQLFPIHFHAMLVSGPEEEAALTDMLRPDLPEEALSALLDALDRSPEAADKLTASPALYERLELVCREAGLEESCLRFLHRRRQGRSGIFGRFLCQRYLSAINRGVFPDELLAEAEEFALEHLQNLRDPAAVMCVYLIETRRGRLPFRAFALCCLQQQLSIEEDPDIENWLQDETAQLPPGTPLTELAIFACVLADPGCDVYEYLSFCRSFRLLTDEEKDNVLQMTPSYATEAESVLLLHLLYQDFHSAETWAMCSRLPFQDRPQVYARLLCCGAQARAGQPQGLDSRGESAVTWSRCVDYCRKNGQSALVLQALEGWAQEILARNRETFPWYIAKDFVNVISELCQSGECIPEWPAGQTRGLVQSMCSIFGRINTAAAGDSNHTTLRTIDELAVLTGHEDVVLSCPNTQESLLGQNRKLAFVLALLLLQAGRTEKASALLQTLVKLRDGMAYPVLGAELAGKSAEELEQWRQDPVSQSLIRAILPNGNTLNGLSMRTLIMDHLLDNSCDVGISAVEELLRNNEHDCMLHVVLFILCKRDFRRHIPQIYRALAGVYRNYSLDERGIERTWYYTRSRSEVFRLLMVTRAVMVRLGLPIPEQDRDMNEFLGSSSLISQMGRQDKSAFVQNGSALFTEVSSKFTGYDEAGVELWVEALMGSVTGNWTPFLTHAYQQHLVSLSHFECTNYSSWGLLRCVFQVLQSLPREERPLLLGWLQENVDKGKGTLKRLYTVHRIVSTLFSTCDLDAVSEQMLSLPWEEHFICLGDLKDISSPAVASCYQWFRKNTPLSALQDSLRVMIQICQDILKAQVLYGDANKLFGQGQDAQAEIYYRVLCNTQGVPSAGWNGTLYPERFNELSNDRRAWYQEFYQSRSQICGAFSGSHQVIEKLGRPDFKLRSCFNMLVTMLSSRRAGEIHRLARYFSGNGRRLAIGILKVVSPEVEDSVKLEICDSFRRLDDAAEGLSLLLSQQRQDGKYLFLQDGSLGLAMQQRYQKLTGSRYANHRVPCCLTLTAPPDPSAFAQTEPPPELMERSGGADAGYENASAQARPLQTVPGFALEIQGRMSGQELEALEVLQAAYERCSSFDYERRAALSGQIYCRLSMDGQSTDFAVSEALIGYGLDYFAFHTSDCPQSDPQLAFQAEHELALYCKNCPSDGDNYRSFLTKVPIALQRMLKSSPSVDALVQDYQCSTQGYDALAAFAGGELPFLFSIFSVIQGLARAYSNISGPKLQNVENYKTAYTAALKQLEGLTISREFGEEWLNVRNSLVTKLYDALNSLDQRPDLSVNVLNHRMQGMASDCVFGELQNTGRERAADIELQATFFDGENSWLGRKYGYANLLPGEKVAFALDYEVKKPDTQQLQYTLNVTYYHNQRQMSRDPEKGTLTIVPPGPLSFSADPYATDYPVQFDIDENGCVVGKDFFGREQQMEAMRETVANKPFSQFKNFVLRGIRRSGKTSLLNYLETYVSAVCQDTVVVRIDCQSIVTQPVQNAFITKVLYALERRLPAATRSEAWRQLTGKWSLSPGEEDRSPSLLQDFYLDLELAMNPPGSETRKGLLLLIDEFDVMLHRMQSSQQDYILLQGLRTITQNSSCRRAVHFVLCGSNNLISYTRKGERYYQTFQDFKPQIEVDELPQHDLEDMLLAPFRDNPEVVLPKETLAWVRRYTGGLVWYTKQLGNQMLRVAKEHHRGVVYPSDVCRAFSSICEESYCIQFYEGCEDMEHDVLEALASLSTRYQSYVTLDRLKEQLAGMMRKLSPEPVSQEGAGPLLRQPHMDGQIADSLEKLIDLKLIQKDGTGRDRYCFKREIYRRFFRTQITRVDKGESLPDQMDALNISKPKPLDEF